MFKKACQSWQRFRETSRRRHRLLGILTHPASLLAVVGILTFILTFSLVLQPHRVGSDSMSPTLAPGDYILVSRIGKLWSGIVGNDYTPKRGEIVVFRSLSYGRDLRKRVIGLPGERVVIQDNTITIYNEENPASFILNLDLSLPDFPANEALVDRLVGEQEIFVIGDNRLPRKSVDSRNGLGNIALDDIKGVAFVRVAPFSKFHFF